MLPECNLPESTARGRIARNYERIARPGAGLPTAES